MHTQTVLVMTRAVLAATAHGMQAQAIVLARMVDHGMAALALAGVTLLANALIMAGATIGIPTIIRANTIAQAATGMPHASALIGKLAMYMINMAATNLAPAATHGMVHLALAAANLDANHVMVHLA